MKFCAGVVPLSEPQPWQPSLVSAGHTAEGVQLSKYLLAKTIPGSSRICSAPVIWDVLWDFCSELGTFGGPAGGDAEAEIQGEFRLDFGKKLFLGRVEMVPREALDPWKCPR